MGVRNYDITQKTGKVIAARTVDASQELIVISRDGIVIRFKEEDARSMGRTAHGVRGITLDEGNYVIGMETITPDSTASILTVTERGYGKRTLVSEYRLQGRAGRGIISVKVTDRNGPAVSFHQVRDGDEIMVMTAEGKILRTKVDDVREIGRNAQGVRLIDMEETDRVVGVAKLAESVGEAAGEDKTNGDESGA